MHIFDVVTSIYTKRQSIFNCGIVLISNMWQPFSQELAFRNRDKVSSLQKYNKYHNSGIRMIFCYI